MWHSVGLWLAGIGGRIKAIAAAVALVVAAWFGHKARVRQAERKGAKSGATSERDRIEAEASRQSHEVKERAHGVRERIRNSDPDDLADRMRRGASDYRK